MDVDPGGAPGGAALPDIPPPAEVPPPPPAATPTKRGRRRRVIPLLLVGLVAVGSVLGAILGVRQSSNPADAVASAIAGSLHNNTADVALRATLTVEGTTLVIAAHGGTDFRNNDASMSMRISAAGQTIIERVVAVGSTDYVAVSGDSIAKVEPGKSWLSVSLGRSGSSSQTTGSGSAGNASALIKVLGAPGNTVAALGRASVDGHSVQQYSVRVTRAQLRHDLAEEHLPSFVAQDVALLHDPDVTYIVSIDGSNLLRRSAATVHFTADNQHLVEHVTTDYSNYGVPVHVAAPPSHLVVPIGTFLQRAEAEGARVTV
jgi:hypothetical protein